MKLINWPLMVQWGGDWPTRRDHNPPWPHLTVPNVTAQPSTDSVSITVLLYNGPLLCNFNVPTKGLITQFWIILTQITNKISFFSYLYLDFFSAFLAVWVACLTAGWSLSLYIRKTILRFLTLFKAFRDIHIGFCSRLLFGTIFGYKLVFKI